jgi:nickel/cobalt transporter (NicO) family protein
MPVTSTAAYPATRPERRRHLLFATAVALGALLGVLALGTLASHWIDAGAVPPPRNPFGGGVREGGGPATGIAGWILATQGAFYQELTRTVRALAGGPGAGWSLAGLSFAYGVFHAAGPGHGKAVISAWILANEKALRRGLAMAGAAALLQAVVATVLVSLLTGLLHVTAMRMTGLVSAVETASFAAVALVGAGLLWTKSRRFAAWWAPAASHGHAPGEACGPGCSHGHMPAPPAEAGFSWRSAGSAVLAAGLRPCSGAIIVLVFALSQGVLPAGIAAVFVMAAGTALTTGALAALAVLAKGTALRLAAGRGDAGARIVGGLEVLAAAFVLAFGLALLSGSWTSSAAG